MSALPPSPSENSLNTNVTWQRNLSNFNSRQRRLSEQPAIPYRNTDSQPQSFHYSRRASTNTSGGRMRRVKSTVWFDNFGCESVYEHMRHQQQQQDDPFGDEVDTSLYWPSDELQIAEEKVISYIDDDDDIDLDNERPRNQKDTSSSTASSIENSIPGTTTTTTSRTTTTPSKATAKVKAQAQAKENLTAIPNSRLSSNSSYFQGSKKFSKWLDKRLSNVTSTNGKRSPSTSLNPSSTPQGRSSSWGCFFGPTVKSSQPS